MESKSLIPFWKTHLPDPAIQLEECSELQLIAMCVWGEARGEPLEGQIAVAWVVRNRAESSVKWWGNSYRAVILWPRQFSAFNPNDPNRGRLRGPFRGRELAAWKQAVGVAFCVMEDLFTDPTDGATHYHRVGLTPPRWARGGTVKAGLKPALRPVATIGRHVFYRAA